MVDTTIFKMVDDYLNLLNLEDEEKKKELQAMSEEERYKLQSIVLNPLPKTYPCLYMFLMKYLNRDRELKEYIDLCETFQHDRKKYTYYVHGYFLPWLDKQRADGKLKKGK